MASFPCQHHRRRRREHTPGHTATARYKVVRLRHCRALPCPSFGRRGQGPGGGGGFHVMMAGRASTLPALVGLTGGRLRSNHAHEHGEGDARFMPLFQSLSNLTLCNFIKAGQARKASRPGTSPPRWPRPTHQIEQRSALRRCTGEVDIASFLFSSSLVISNFIIAS